MSQDPPEAMGNSMERDTILTPRHKFQIIDSHLVGEVKGITIFGESKQIQCELSAKTY